MTMPAPPAVLIVPRSLQAVLDKQAGSSRAFLVTVEIEVEPSWTVELVEARPQGINHLIKLLRLEIVRPPGAATAATIVRTLRYAETPPSADYSEVWLGDGDRAVSARVRRRLSGAD